MHDILVEESIGEYFFKEPDLWKFIWSITKVLQFNLVRDIQR